MCVYSFTHTAACSSNRMLIFIARNAYKLGVFARRSTQSISLSLQRYYIIVIIKEANSYFRVYVLHIWRTTRKNTIKMKLKSY